VIAYVAIAGGIIAVELALPSGRWPPRLHHSLVGFGIAAAFAVVLLCSFFTNPIGIVDSLRSFKVYLTRAGAAGAHVNPWYFYLQILTWYRVDQGPIWSEALILILAVVGGVTAWTRKDWGTRDSRLHRFFSVYTLLMTAAYSGISYKTPWCIISFLHGMIVLAGFGAVTILKAVANKPAKILVGLLLVAAAGNLGWQAWRASFRLSADPRNPYVYAQTSTDLLNLVKRVEQIAAVSPQGHDMLIAVVAEPYNTWPLPWYFRKFSAVGYWTRARDVPEKIEVPIIITSLAEQEEASSRLSGEYQHEYYGLRPDVLLALHIRKDLWEQFLKTR
jgi:predicted membrane-bound mannosyltransferase